jgi:hypothetical protein
LVTVARIRVFRRRVFHEAQLDLDFHRLACGIVVGKRTKVLPFLGDELRVASRIVPAGQVSRVLPSKRLAEEIRSTSLRSDPE